MSQESTDVALARLEGRLTTITELLDVRLGQVSLEAGDATRTARAAHSRMDSEMGEIRRDVRDDLDEVKSTVADLMQWRERVIGISVGIGIGSGVISGLIVTLITRIAGAE